MNILKEVKVQSVPGKVCGLVYITPAQAKQIVAEHANPNNRRVNKAVMSRYTKDMNNGEFAETTLLSFDNNGMLLDGHNRLNGLANSSCDGQWFVMLYGAKNDRFIFDRGSQRTTAQTMQMNGVKIVPQDVAIARAVLDISAAYRSQSKSTNSVAFCFTDVEVQNFIIDNKDYFEQLHNTVAKNGTMTRKAAVACAILQALRCGVSEETLARFGEVLNNGYMDDRAEGAAITLRKQLERDFKKGRYDMRKYEMATEEAIAAFIIGKERKQSFGGTTCPYTMLLK